MATVVSNKKPQIKLGLTGLAGAFGGKVAGEEKNIERALMERDQSRQERQLNETIRNNTIMQEMAARQLEVMQEQNRLTREQEERLTRFREGQTNVRQGVDIAARKDMQASEQAFGLEKQSRDQEFSWAAQARELQQRDIASQRQLSASIYGADSSRAAAQYSADSSRQAQMYSADSSRAASDFRTMMQRQTDAERTALQREEFLNTGLTQLRMSGEVLNQYGGSWTNLNTEQRGAAAEALAREIVGPQRWDGSGGVQMASDEEKSAALQKAAFQMANQQQREQTFTNQVTASAIAELEARHKLNEGMDPTLDGVDGDPAGAPTRFSELFDLTNVTEAGLSPINEEFALRTYGEQGAENLAIAENAINKQVELMKSLARRDVYVSETQMQMYLNAYRDDTDEMFRNWTSVNPSDRELIQSYYEQTLQEYIDFVFATQADKLSTEVGQVVEAEEGE